MAKAKYSWEELQRRIQSGEKGTSPIKTPTPNPEYSNGPPLPGRVYPNPWNSEGHLLPGGPPLPAPYPRRNPSPNPEKSERYFDSPLEQYKAPTPSPFPWNSGGYFDSPLEKFEAPTPGTPSPKTDGRLYPLGNAGGATSVASGFAKAIAPVSTPSKVSVPQSSPMPMTFAGSSPQPIPTMPSSGSGKGVFGGGSAVPNPANSAGKLNTMSWPGNKNNVGETLQKWQKSMDETNLKEQKRVSDAMVANEAKAGEGRVVNPALVSAMTKAGIPGADQLVNGLYADQTPLAQAALMDYEKQVEKTTLLNQRNQGIADDYQKKMDEYAATLTKISEEAGLRAKTPLIDESVLQEHLTRVDKISKDMVASAEANWKKVSSENKDMSATSFEVIGQSLMENFGRQEQDLMSRVKEGDPQAQQELASVRAAKSQAIAGEMGKIRIASQENLNNINLNMANLVNQASMQGATFKSYASQAVLDVQTKVVPQLELQRSMDATTSMYNIEQMKMQGAGNVATFLQSIPHFHTSVGSVVAMLNALAQDADTRYDEKLDELNSEVRPATQYQMGSVKNGGNISQTSAPQLTKNSSGMAGAGIAKQKYKATTIKKPTSTTATPVAKTAYTGVYDNLIPDQMTFDRTVQEAAQNGPTMVNLANLIKTNKATEAQKAVAKKALQAIVDKQAELERRGAAYQKSQELPERPDYTLSVNDQYANAMKYVK